jgi:predicted ATPase
MKFRKIILRNWKNFREAEVKIGDHLILIGGNASGKSNFLDAFRFLRDISSEGGSLQKAVLCRGGMRNVRNFYVKQEEVSVRVEMEDDFGKQWTYEIAFNQASRKRKEAVVVREYVSCDGEPFLERPDDGDKNDPVRLSASFLNSTVANKAFRVIPEFFSSIRFAVSFLWEMEATPTAILAPKLALIEKELRNALEINLRLTAEEEYGHTSILFRIGRRKVREEDVSEGTFRLMGLLWDALNATGPLLIEEPERHLAPRIALKLSNILKRLNPNLQIIATTNSPYVIDSFGAHNAVRLLRTSKETHVVEGLT